LRGLKEKYEVHHGVEITDPAIIAAVTYSIRYITDRQLPDKARSSSPNRCYELQIQGQFSLVQALL
jgi:ATP-dependent Clp protease ATP-binding subunit ClpA